MLEMKHFFSRLLQSSKSGCFRALTGVLLLVSLLLSQGCRNDGSLRDRQRWLESSWNDYKALYIGREGYVLDIHRGEVTSEGQSYALLRAVWMRDRKAFERLLGWTDANLLRTDGVYAWRWDPGALRVNDWNTASDADQDIAFALVIASRVFDRADYLERARRLLQAIRHVEGIPLGDGWFPSAGNWAVRNRIVNLSYFTPYAYPYFHRVDPDGKWLQVLKTGYDMIERALALPGVMLIPDFMIVGEDGTIRPVNPSHQLSGDFSFDAMRIYWRVAMDCRLHRNPTACGDPAGSKAMVALLKRDGTWHTRYSTAGTALDGGESPSFFGSMLPVLSMRDPALARSILGGKLSMASLRDLQKKSDRYYDLNWVWFGLALSDGRIEEFTPQPTDILR